MIKKIIKKLDYFLNWIYTKRFNNKMFPKEIAKKCPVWITRSTVIEGCKKGSIKIDTDNIEKYMVQIGYEYCAFGINDSNKTYLRIDSDGQLVFKGKALISTGCIIRIFAGGCVEIGDGLYFNAKCSVDCKKKIIIGDDVLCGWNIDIRDGDGHDIFELENQKVINNDEEVIIGNHVWLASHVTILKNTYIADNCIIGMNSTVTKSINESNCIAVGAPARIVRRGVDWRH